LSRFIETFYENSKKELTHVFRRDKITKSLKRTTCEAWFYRKKL